MKMREPKAVCRDRNMYSYMSYNGAEAMSQAIREDMRKILTTPSDKTVVEQVMEYFDIRDL